MNLKKIVNLPKNIKEFAKTPDKFVTRHLQQSETIQSIDLFPTMDCYLLSNPDEIEHVYLKYGKIYQRGALFDPIRKIIGNGLPVNDGDFWLKQRRMMQPAFHTQVLPIYAGEIEKAINEMIENWKHLIDKKDSIVLNMEEEMMNLTSNVTLKLLFSSEITREKQNRAVFILDEINKMSLKHITNPLAIPLKFPTPENYRFNKLMKEINLIMDEVISKRKKEKGNNKVDLLQMLLDSTDEITGEGMSDSQLKSEILNLYIAGTETTANILAWTLHLLAKNKKIENKVREEVENEVNKGVSNLEIIRNLRFTDNVMKEVMRMYPPSWLLAREAMSDDQIGEIKVKKGSQMLIPIRGMHMNPKYWENSESFDPDRFSQNTNLNKFIYFPFGGGSHLCMGKEFARMEYFLAIKEIYQNFNFENISDSIEPEIFISLRPKGGVFMKVTKRVY